MYFSRCADPQCKDPLLQVTWTGQQTHPNCHQTSEELAARRFVDAIQRGASEAEIQNLEAAVNKVDEPPSLGSAALWYVSVGWAVFPLIPQNQAAEIAAQEGVTIDKVLKRPAVKNGLNAATLDADKVRSWWERFPSSGIGLITGCQFDVIDVDGIEGYRSLSELGDSILPDIHGKVATWSGGMHLFVSATGDGNRAGVRPGIDYRGQGGYVCAPPTEILGSRYTWTMKPSPAILGSADGQG